MRVVIKSSMNSAFSLAEVLVIIMMLGIMSTIIIPSLLLDIQKQELKTAFKKTYSDLAQATQKIMQDNGRTMLGVCEYGDYNCIRDKYAAHLNVVKSCDFGATFGNCWNGKNDFKFLNDTLPPTDTWDDFPGLVLNNGSMLRIAWLSSVCKDNTFSPRGECGFIAIDVNGLKKPNIVGRDIFWVHIYDNGIAPWGNPDDEANGSSKAASCKKNNTGFGCAALVLQGKDY